MKSFVLCLAVVLSPLLALSQSYDLVIQGGRAIDPETGLDAVRNVGISITRARSRKSLLRRLQASA